MVYRKRIFIGLIFTILCFTIFLAMNIPFLEIYNLPNVVNASRETVEQINKENMFGKYVSANYSDLKEASSGMIQDEYITFKLFNLITLKSVKANSMETILYAGGNTVGFSLNGDGVIVIGSGLVTTEEGEKNTIENSDILSGDIIKEIGEDSVKSVSDIYKIVNKEENKNKELKVKIKRKNKEFETTIKPALDKKSKVYKIGLWVKDDASGIGTLTYIDKEKNRFGALGHAITDNETKMPFEVQGGEMYPCTIIGLKKGSKGKAGELKGLFLQGRNYLGLVDKNNNCGVFGQINENSNILKDKKELKAGGRLTVKPGKAKIRTTIDGSGVKDYDIEIIKTNYQNASSEKSMVIRVTDKELLKKTGGIIQGMSGSPIIQNDKIIGAVTHVFVSDPTKGFGIYLDWMINQ